MFVGFTVFLVIFARPEAAPRSHGGADAIVPLARPRAAPVVWWLAAAAVTGFSTAHCTFSGPVNRGRWPLHPWFPS